MRLESYEEGKIVGSGRQLNVIGEREEGITEDACVSGDCVDNGVIS